MPKTLNQILTDNGIEKVYKFTLIGKVYDFIKDDKVYHTGNIETIMNKLKSDRLI